MPWRQGQGAGARFGLSVTEEEFGKAPRQVKPEALPGQGVTLEEAGGRC